MGGLYNRLQVYSGRESFSMSFQALILSRRQTQQSMSVFLLAPGLPQTRQRSNLLAANSSALAGAGGGMGAGSIRGSSARFFMV